MELKDNILDIHIGKIIREKLSEKSMTVIELAARIHRANPTVHNIFERKSIDTDLLIAISKALDYDFIHQVYYTEETAPVLSISIKTEKELLQKLKLFEEFIRSMEQ